MSALATGLSLVLVVLAGWSRRPTPRRALHRSVTAGSTWRTVRLDERSSRLLIAAIAVLAGYALAGPAVAVIAGASTVGGRHLVSVVRSRRRRAAICGAVPDLVDLFLVSASAGQPVASSLAVVAHRAPMPVASFVASASARFDGGLPLAECLDELGADLGPSGWPLTTALRQAAATGVPLVPLLEGVAAAARDERRRRAQEVARRLPVTMLLPLVACTLPAAVLLAVVPVLLVSIGSLNL